MYDTHVTGTRNVLDIAPPQARLVHTSSVVTVGASHGRPLTEDDTWNLRGLQVEYVQAKRTAEELALAAAARDRDVARGAPLHTAPRHLPILDAAGRKIPYTDIT
ncbi:MAG: NAD-dependent epimerase/dehydratase family protein [Candidatus Methylomirabilales bacterium]